MATAKKTTKSAAPKTTTAPKTKKAKAPAEQAVKNTAAAQTKKAAAAAQEKTQPVKAAAATQAAAPATQKKAQAPAVKEMAAAPAVKEQAQQPAVKEAAAAPAVKEQAASPAVKEQAASPAVKEQAASPAVKAEAASPAVKEAAHSPAVKEQAAAPAVKEQAASPAVREEAASPAVQEKAAAPAVQEAAPAPQHSAQQEGPAAAPATHSGLRELTPRPMPAGNPYLPMAATVKEVIQETGNIKTIRVVLDDAQKMAAFTYQPGQVGQLSVFGAGESTFVINTPPSCKDYLQFSVMQAGEVTSAIHRLSAGDKVGVRAPLGNYFPYEQWKGKDIVFVGGGIGMAPIRTIMLHLLEHKQDYGKISLLYGARSPRDMAFSYELEGWLNNPDLDCTLCIDAPFEGWPHKVGLIPNVLLEMAPKADSIAVLCGPPIMIKFTVQALEKLGFAPENIITTLEKRMKCGIGICGRCNIGGKYVCVDGPVFTWAQLKELPADM